MRLHLEITGICNLHCVCCYNASYNTPDAIKNELSFCEWAKIIDEANRMGCRRYTISGGEPFLAPWLLKLVKCCQAPTIVFTNATMITAATVAMLEEIPMLKGLRISLDGLDAHDKYRLGSRGVDVINIIRLFVGSRLTVGVTTMLSSEILQELMAIYEILRELSIEHWRLDLPFLAGRYQAVVGQFKQGSFEEVVVACRNMISVYLGDGKPFHLGIANMYKSQIADMPYGEFDLEIHPCSYDDVICIKPNGDITVCAAYNLVMGNVREFETLEDAIRKAKSHAFYAIKIKDINQCFDCRYLKLCGAGCRADAFYLKGSDTLPDPVCCSLWPLVETEIFPILPDNEKQSMVKLVNKQGGMPERFEKIDDIVPKKIK